MAKRKVRSIGKAFAEELDAAGLSSQDFAVSVGVSVGAVQSWRQDRAKPIKMAREKIAAKYPNCVLLNVNA